MATALRLSCVSALFFFSACTYVYTDSFAGEARPVFFGEGVDRIALQVGEAQVELSLPRGYRSAGQFRASYELSDKAFSSLGSPVRYFRLGGVAYDRKGDATGAVIYFEVRRADGARQMEIQDERTRDARFFGIDRNEASYPVGIRNFSGANELQWRCYSMSGAQLQSGRGSESAASSISVVGAQPSRGDQCYALFGENYFLHVFSIYGVNKKIDRSVILEYQKLFLEVVSGISIVKVAG